jgi:hypothetical protein
LCSVFSFEAVLNLIVLFPVLVFWSCLYCAVWRARVLSSHLLICFFLAPKDFLCQLSVCVPFSPGQELARPVQRAAPGTVSLSVCSVPVFLHCIGSAETGSGIGVRWPWLASGQNLFLLQRFVFLCQDFSFHS